MINVCLFLDLPDIRLDWLASSYQPQLSSFKEKAYEFCAKRMSQLNQTNLEWVDIYTHLPSSMNGRPSTPSISKIPILIFLISGFLCLTFSAVFHLFCALNLKTYNWLIRLDYAGIALLVTGSNAPVYYYGFACNPNQIGYLYLTIVIFVGFIVFLLTLCDFMHK
jgi:predicted membrane channel-forming protein YqfA (hemolysin III family)